MMKYYYRGKSGKELLEGENFKVGSWIHAISPSEEEQKILVEQHGIDEGLLKDALDPYEVPRIEQEEGYTYMYTRVPHKSGEEVATTPVLIVVADTFVLTVTQQVVGVFDAFLKEKREVFTTQRTKFFFMIFSELNRQYAKFVTSIVRGVRKMSVNLERITNQDIVDFVVYERILNDFLFALVPTNTAIEETLAGKYFKVYDDDQDFIEDLSLSQEQLIQQCTSNLKKIVNIRSAYSSIMTNNLNRVIKRLTTITIILTVPTMIAGIFGMNVALPLDAQGPQAFWAIVGVALLLSFGIYYLIVGIE